MQKLRSAVDKHRKLILDAERYIWKNPETGYKEFKTSKYLAEKFEQLGYKLNYAENITGFYTTIDTGKVGPTILILGELDSVICPNHPESDKQTGAVHSCGHNAQAATLLGLAAALKEDGVLDGLCGKIKLCAVPAEELLEIEYRSQLIKKGVIKYYGGKSEFLYRGYFDDVDIAFMVHVTTSPTFRSIKAAVGCLAKKITYKGLASHAGGSPWDGRNALYAATNGLNSANALRETFQEKDLIRFHPIITHGGSMVNAIPEKTVIESYVRGANFEGIVSANKRINQALCGSALSMGCNVEIEDFPGYAPNVNDDGMIDLAKDAATLAIPEEEYLKSDFFSTGSTDMGDLSCIMPTIHPYAPGAVGTGHGADYYIVDPEKACIKNAKWQLGMLKLLLENDGARAYEIKQNFKPRFESKKAFLDYCDSLNSNGDRITYSDGKAEVRI